MSDTHMAVKHMCLTPWDQLLRESTICVMSIDAALGKAIRKHRQLAGIRQEDVPIDQGNLSKIENGKQSLSMDRLVEIAAALRTTPSAIWATAEAELYPSRAITEAERAGAEAARRSEYQIALAGAVEAIIATTPDAATALAEFLRKAHALSSVRSDRKILAQLADRAETARAQRQPKSSASRARAPAG